MALFNWFKRKNAQAVEDKDKGGMKFNAADVFVDVNGKKISVGDPDEERLRAGREADARDLAEQVQLLALGVAPLSVVDLGRKRREHVAGSRNSKGARSRECNGTTIGWRGHKRGRLYS